MLISTLTGYAGTFSTPRSQVALRSGDKGYLVVGVGVVDYAKLWHLSGSSIAGTSKLIGSGRIAYYSPENNITVITEDGRVVTVSSGNLKIR